MKFLKQQAHDIALEYLKRAWKEGTFSHENCRASMDCYIAAYKYALDRLTEEKRTENSAQIERNTSKMHIKRL